MKTVVYYYTFSNGESPVRQFIDSHPRSKSKVMRIIQTIEEYGLQSVIPHLKKLTGTPLWEIRILGQESIRVLYVGYRGQNILLLHAFEKKTQKTPPREIATAIRRLKEVGD